jgi:hypothetical protein
MNTFTNKSSLIPSDSVRVVQNQDGAVLLDIRQGLCLSMTPVGVQIWDFLKLNFSADQITDSLVAKFSVPSQQVSRDVIAFINDLKQKGLLLSSKPTGKQEHLGRTLALILGGHRMLQRWRPRSDKGVRFLFWKALIALFALDLLHISRQFQRMHDLVQDWTIAPRSAPPNTVERVCRALNYACVWYPKRVFCLQRSAVATCLLRSCGVQAQMVMGAQKSPFEAHAWTEVNGQPFNESRDVQDIYLVWKRC